MVYLIPKEEIHAAAVHDFSTQETYEDAYDRKKGFKAGVAFAMSVMNELDKYTPSVINKEDENFNLIHRFQMWLEEQLEQGYEFEDNVHAIRMFIIYQRRRT